MSELASLIHKKAAPTAIADYLDALAPDARAREANSLGRADQALLFEIAGDGPRIKLSHFVPRDVADLDAVHHPGRNTIATFPYFQRFQKRFARQSADAYEVIGYNFSNAFFVRPGYFVAYETAGHEVWADRGGVVVDYHRVPEGAVPSGWPAIVPNSVGIQKLVYHLTRDFMRRVSSHVSIGRASREDAEGDRILDYWFTLVRDDARPDTATPTA